MDIKDSVKLREKLWQFANNLPNSPCFPLIQYIIVATFAGSTVHGLNDLLFKITDCALHRT